MKFHTVNTITNGVLVKEYNKGQRVDWRSSLVEMETGEVHREFYASGVIRDFTHIAMPNPIDGKMSNWLYVIFTDAVINGKKVVEAGVPVGFFR